MRIYRKTAITLGIVFVFLFLLTASVTYYVFLTHTEEIERNVLNDNTLRVHRAFDNEISHMDSTVYDWAAWDATYEYMTNNNSDYIISNLDDIETFLTLDINFVLYYNTNGTLVYGQACDLENGIQVPLSEEILDAIPKNNILINHSSIDSTVSGIVMIGDSPTIIASKPIIKSDYSGPIHGTLIMGRFLDRSFIHPMEEQILLPIEIYPLNNNNMPYDFAEVRNQLLDEKYVTRVNKDKNGVSGYFLIEDIYGKPVLIARTEMPRLIYKEGLDAISVTFYLTLLISILFAVLLSFLLKKNLLSRITFLRNGINEIDFKGDINSRIKIQGNDELSELAENINSMLDSLQEKSIIFQSTIESVSYGLVAFDKNSKVLKGPFYES